MNKPALNSYLRKKTSEAYIETQTGPLNRSQSPILFNRTPTRRSLLAAEPSAQTHPTQRKSAVLVNTHILLQQNKQLISQNKELNALLMQKIQKLEHLQIVQTQKQQEQSKLMKEIQSQKIRFIGEVTKMKIETDKKIEKLVSEINLLHQEKYQLEDHYQQIIRKSNLKMEQQRKKQVENMAKNYTQSITLAKQQIQSLKSTLESKENDLEIISMENKQRINQLQHGLEKSSTEMNHIIHVHKLQSSEQKQFYQNKIQQIHLQYRREKQNFIHQHDSQIKKLQMDIQKLKLQRQIVLMEADQIKTQNNCKLVELINNKENIERERADIEEQCKKTFVVEREKQIKLCNSQMEMMELRNKHQIKSLMLENGRLIEICTLKASQMKKIEQQLSQTRANHQTEIQRYQLIIKELENNIFLTQIQNDHGEEIEKIKYAQLREADIKSLRSYYENQIGILMETLLEKDAANQVNREKFHQELKLKAEMRKSFEIDQLGSKARIRLLEIEISNLKNQIKLIETEMISSSDLKYTVENKLENRQSKADSISKGEEKNWKNIITSKDKQIEQLQARIRQLKDHHSLQLLQKDRQLTALRQKCDILESDCTKSVNHLQSQLEKAKNKLFIQGQQHQKELAVLKEEQKQILQQSIEQSNKITQKYENQLLQSLTSRKKLKEQIETLKRQADHDKHQLHQALHQTKETSNIAVQKIQNGLEEYFNSFLSVKQAEISDLKEQLQQKQNDLRDAKVNYTMMQRKMEYLIESHGKLRQIEVKVMNIGMDNNAVKSVREVVGRR